MPAWLIALDRHFPIRYLTVTLAAVAAMLGCFAWVAFDQLAWLAIDELRRLRASRDLSVALAQPKRHSVWIKPPCQQCGAMTADEAVSRCMGSRAEGGCHGNELWPD